MTIKTELQKIRERMNEQEFTLAEFTSFHEEGGCQPNIKSCILCSISEILHSDQKGKLADCVKRLVEGLENIAKKRPHDVSREEAADMACEFVLLARTNLSDASAILTGSNEKEK